MGTILIVDDEAQLVSLLSRFFSRLGFTVLTATNGRDGLKQVEEEHPDLVLLDIRMPGMDGMQVLRRIRARSRDIAVIMITAAQDTILASEAMALGAYDYITKPIDFAHLESTVLSLFPPLPEPTEPEPTVTEPAPPAPALEVEEATERLEQSSPVMSGLANPPAAPPRVIPPEAERAVALASECFRLVEGLTPHRLAQGIEECAARLLASVATGGNGYSHVKTLRLYLQVAQQLGSVTPDDLARLELFCQQVEAGS
jgi:CheY-like chemotaxis protein